MDRTHPIPVASGVKRQVGNSQCRGEGAPQPLVSFSVEWGWELASLRPTRQSKRRHAQGNRLLGSAEL